MGTGWTVGAYLSYTGIRLSEICWLRDSDFLLEEDRMQVRRTLQRVTMRQGADEPDGSGGRQDTVVYDPGDSGYRDLPRSVNFHMLRHTFALMWMSGAVK